MFRTNTQQQPVKPLMPVGAGLVKALEKMRAESPVVSLTPRSSPSLAVEACKGCSGTGWVINKAGTLIHCKDCWDSRPFCGLEGAELELTVDSILGAGDMHDVLRYLARYCISNPYGWLTLWGKYGTAKSLTAQIVVASLARKGMSARYIHSKKLEQMWFDDMHNDTSNGLGLESVDVLVVDELDKMNLNSNWVRQGLQALADARYRSGLGRKTLTVWVVQTDPEKVLPGDIASRMSDGRWHRPWLGGKNSLTFSAHGETVVDGCIEVTGADARPFMRPLDL